MSSIGSSSGGMNVVSEQIVEFLLTEMSLYAARSCAVVARHGGSSGYSNNTNANNNSIQNNDTVSNATTTDNTIGTSSTMSGGGGGGGGNNGGGSGTYEEEESMTVSAEMAAAKLERMGHAVGYRITERLAQNKTWNTSAVVIATNKGTPSSAGQQQQQQQQQQSSSSAGTTAEAQMAAATAAQQLEAVKFLCKEVWMEIFRKQIDKLQTNHRGVFVLKDFELKWLTRFPVGTEVARVSAIRLLAFPCGIVRGALSNLGIPAVVSCDFLADGQRMAACSFNIKVK